MNAEKSVSFFYRNMGILLLALVLSGFGLAAIGNDASPLELPLLFHIHAFSYLAFLLGNECHLVDTFDKKTVTKRKPYHFSFLLGY